MTEVEHIATWVGLILAVGSIVLASVSIAFTWAVNRRAEALNDQTIKALTKLETDMGRVSDDVRGLIRDAWSRLVVGPPPGSEEPEVTDTAVKPTIPATTPTAPPSYVPTPQPSAPRRDPYAATVETIRRLSPTAQWLLRVLHEKGGLTQLQYGRLRRTPLGRPLFELTQAHLVSFYGVPGVEEDRFYHGVPPNISDAVRIAVSLMDEPPESVKSAVTKELSAVGYEGAQADDKTKIGGTIAATIRSNPPISSGKEIVAKPKETASTDASPATAQPQTAKSEPETGKDDSNSP